MYTLEQPIITDGAYWVIPCRSAFLGFFPIRGLNSYMRF